MVQSRTTQRITARNLLKTLAYAGALTGVIVAPNSIELIEKTLNFRKNNAKKARKTLTYLKYYKLVEERIINGESHYRLTKKGIDKFESVILSELTIRTPKKWDHKWRAVIFDKPKVKSSQRRKLLFYLRMLDFYMIQDSFWIHPFACDKEIGAVLSSLRLENFVTYIVIEDGNFISHAEQVFKKKKLLI